MGKPSKENSILELFFEEPTKHWHFSMIKQIVPIADNKISRWLSVFLKKGLIKKIKERKKMPYYISNYTSSEYKILKKLYGLNKLYASGLLTHLASLQKVQSVILFGSFSRWDWYKNSDVDIFIYGDPDGLRIVPYEIELHRDIQLFLCENKKDISKLGQGLLKNIIKGNLIKGNLEFLEVAVNA